MKKFEDPIEGFVEGVREGSKGAISGVLQREFPPVDLKGGSPFRSKLKQQFIGWLVIGACLLGYILYGALK